MNFRELADFDLGSNFTLDAGFDIATSLLLQLIYIGIYNGDLNKSTKTLNTRHYDIQNQGKSKTKVNILDFRNDHCSYCMFKPFFRRNYDICFNFQRTADPCDENIKERSFQPDVAIQNPQAF